MSAIRATLLLLAFTVPLTVAAETVDSLDTLDQVLPAVASFEQGQSSGPLVAVEKFVFTLPTDSPLRTDVERKLIDALKSARTADAKRFLCTQLRVVGTANCVSAIAELLADEEVAHMAIYCLGSMEAPEAGIALHQGLSQTTGDVQAGILNALADRRQANIAGDCVVLLKSANLTVARAAARALGRLGAFDAVKPLQRARADAPDELKTEIDNALLCTAELLAAKGDQRAHELYKKYTSKDFPETLRFAALRGIAQRGSMDDAAPLLKAISSDNEKERRFAISLVNLIKGAKATQIFASTLSSLDPDDQVILLRVLGVRCDAAAVPVLVAASGSPNEPVRVAALEALGTAGNADSLAAIATAAATAQGLTQKIARASLVKLTGDAVDVQLLKLGDQGEPSVRAEAIRALAARGATGAVPTVLEAASDSDKVVRMVAIEALGTLASPDNLPAMVALAVQPIAADDRPAISDAIGRLFFRIDDASARSQPVLDKYEAASPDAQATLLAVLAKSAAPEALAKVRSALRSDDSIICDAAVGALADWPDAAAIEPLLGLLGSKSSTAHKEAAVKGYVRLAELSDDPTTTYIRVLKHVTTVNDRKRVLEGLGLNAESPDALTLALQYVDDKPLQATAGLAALRIAHRLRESHEQLAREALHRVIAEVDHGDVRSRSQEVLNDLDKYEDHILQWVGVGPFTEKGKDGKAIYNTVFPPEQSDAEGIEWEPITKGIGRWDINLESTFGGIDFCAAYVRTRVWSPKAQDALLETGSDDALRIWLNGKLVHEKWKTSGAAPRQERAAIKLNEGWNDLMLKVVDHNGGWVFAARLRQPDGMKLDGLKIEAE